MRTPAPAFTGFEGVQCEGRVKPAEPTAAAFPSAAATFSSAAAFEMPHSESLSQLSQCVREHIVVDTVPSDTRFSLALLLDGVSVFSFEY